MHVFWWHSHLHLWQRLVIWWKLTSFWTRRARLKAASVSYFVSLFFLLIYMGRGIAGGGGNKWMNRFYLSAFQSFISLKHLSEWKNKIKKKKEKGCLSILSRSSLEKQQEDRSSLIPIIQKSKSFCYLLKPLAKIAQLLPECLLVFLAGWALLLEEM